MVYGRHDQKLYMTLAGELVIRWPETSTICVEFGLGKSFMILDDILTLSSFWSGCFICWMKWFTILSTTICVRPILLSCWICWEETSFILRVHNIVVCYLRKVWLQVDEVSICLQEYLLLFNEPPVYHVSVNSSSIMLDENFIAKVGVCFMSAIALV